MRERTQQIIKISEWAVKKTREAIQTSQNNYNFYSIADKEKISQEHLETLMKVLRSRIGVRGSDNKAILDEIRRKLGMDYLSKAELELGVATLFPLTIASLGKTFANVEELLDEVQKKFSIDIQKKKEGLEAIERAATKALKNGIGNCGENSAYSFILLLEYPDEGMDGHAIPINEKNKTPLDIKIERMEYKKPGDHAFVVLNRTSGQVNNIYSWNDDAVICDPWIGVTYTVAQWKDWKENKSNSYYILTNEYGIQLTKPCENNQSYFLGKKTNEAKKIGIHSKNWKEKYAKSENKFFRGTELITIQANREKKRDLYQSVKKDRLDEIEKLTPSELKRHELYLCELAIENNCNQVIQYLFKNPNCGIKIDIILFKIAIESKNFDAFKYLLERSTDKSDL